MRNILQLEHYIHKSTGQGILGALSSLVKGDLEQLSQLADKCNLDAMERGHLRAFLTQVIDVEQVSAWEDKRPAFPVCCWPCISRL